MGFGCWSNTVDKRMAKMKAVKEYFFCSSRLLSNVKEIDEIEQCIKTIEWRPEFAIEVNGIQYFHQHAYNKAFEIEFK
jgi:YHS domain-containing protein